METRARYTVIGAFVLACIFAAFGFVYWLQNSGALGRAIYRIQFDQPVSGLTPGSSVLFNGIRVGVILSLQLDPNDPKRVMTSIAVDPGTPIRADTQVDVSFQGLTGAPAISLRGGLISAPALISQNGQPPLLVAGPGVGQNLTDPRARRCTGSTSSWTTMPSRCTRPSPESAHSPTCSGAIPSGSRA